MRLPPQSRNAYAWITAFTGMPMGTAPLPQGRGGVFLSLVPRGGEGWDEGEPSLRRKPQSRNAWVWIPAFAGMTVGVLQRSAPWQPGFHPHPRPLSFKGRGEKLSLLHWRRGSKAEDTYFGSGVKPWRRNIRLAASPARYSTKEEAASTSPGSSTAAG